MRINNCKIYLKMYRKGFMFRELLASMDWGKLCGRSDILGVTSWLWRIYVGVPVEGNSMSKVM